MIAFLFGGQGGELPRIGADLAEAGGRPRDLVELGSRAAGVDLADLLRRGSPQLHRTEILQPAMVAVGLAVAARLAEAGIEPAFTAGHSLGELTAWAATGAVAPEAIIEAAALRGRLMARQARETPGGMLALEGDEDVLQAALRHGGAQGRLGIAARNGPLSWTLSGEKPALAAVTSRFPSRPVPVAGPWHSEAMAPIVEELRSALAALPRRPARARFLSNRTGEAAPDEACIPEWIAGQLVRPVLWMRTLQSLSRSGVRRFVAIGAGKFLRSLAGHTLGRGFPIHSTETQADLARALEEIPHVQR